MLTLWNGLQETEVQTPGPSMMPAALEVLTTSWFAPAGMGTPKVPSLSSGNCWAMFATQLPSGKLTFCYGKSPFLMGKIHYKWPFSIAMLNYQRVLPFLLLHPENHPRSSQGWKANMSELTNSSWHHPAVTFSEVHKASIHPEKQHAQRSRISMKFYGIGPNSQCSNCTPNMKWPLFNCSILTSVSQQPTRLP